jgi:predicted enzyme related to lactoylglutathione lyase
MMRIGPVSKDKEASVSTQVTSRVGTFVWHENVSTDPAKAQAFYTQLFGWGIEVYKAGEFEYPMIAVDGQMHGGFPPVQDGTPSHWVGNVAVENVDDTVAKAESAGGRLLHGPADIPDVGRFAVLADPQGAVFVAFQAGGEPPQSAGVFVWDELGTQDVEAAESFYNAVFGWTTNDMGEEYGGYKIFAIGETSVGGLMKMPDPSIPSMWQPYVAVEDTDATAAKAGELGGSTLLEPMDVPNVGRLAVLKDPVGAVFGIITSSPQT